jgi:hypothetical protein
MESYDVFISHASQDKGDFVTPLARQLQALGIRVWYDDFALKPGDSLRRSIEKGLTSSRFGLVVLSPSFFEKEWPQKELDALVAMEADGVGRIIPIWHRITRDAIAKHSPILADRLAIPSDIGIGAVAWAVNSKLIALQENSRTQNLPPVTEALQEDVPQIKGHPSDGTVYLVDKHRILDRRSYVAEVLKLLASSYDFSIACMDGVFPYIFYGATESGFLELRELECTKRATMMGVTPEVRAYWGGFWDCYRAGKVFRYAIYPASLRLLESILLSDLTRVRAEEVLRRIERDLRLYPVDVRVVTGSSPYCTFITDSMVLFALISPRVSGLCARDPDLVRIYRQAFDLSFSTGASIHRWIARKLKQLNLT